MASSSTRPGRNGNGKDLLDLLMARLAVLLGDGAGGDETGKPANPTAGTVASGSLLQGPTDARSLLESIVFACLVEGIDDERVESLMHMLGWPGNFVCCSIAGSPIGHDAKACAASVRKAVARRRSNGNEGDGDDSRTARVENASSAGYTESGCLIGEHEGHVIALIRVDDALDPDGVDDIARSCFDADESICLGPTRKSVQGASRAIRAVINALFALKACTRSVPQPMRTEDLLPERALMGDDDARDELIGSIYDALKGDNPNDPTLLTVSVFLDSGASLDATARQLSVHPNTVRYRLKRATEICGWDATDSREAYVLTTAITLGRMRDAGLA